LSTEKLEDVEQVENIQVSIHEEGLCQGEKVLHIDKLPPHSPLLEEDIQNSSMDIPKLAPWLKKKFLKIILDLWIYLKRILQKMRKSLTSHV